MGLHCGSIEPRIKSGRLTFMGMEHHRKEEEIPGEQTANPATSVGFADFKEGGAQESYIEKVAIFLENTMEIKDE